MDRDPVIEKLILAILEHEGPMDPRKLVKRVCYYEKLLAERECPTCGQPRKRTSCR